MIERQAPHRIAKICVVLALASLGIWISWSIIPALLWAAVIAIAIGPLYRRAEARWPNLAGGITLPALFVLAIALLVIVPLILAVIQAARDANDVAAWVSAARLNGIATPQWTSELPFGGEALTRWWQVHLATPQGMARELSRFDSWALFERSRLLGTGILHRGVIFFFTLLTLFFVLRDHRSITAQLKVAGDRLLGPTGERLGRLVVLSVRGTIDGLVLVGLGEGAVMTVAYAFTAVPHPLLLGGLTAIAAMIPFGAAVMFGVAALLLISQGHIAAAIIIVVLGFTVVGIADHFVRPALIGGSTRLPFLWVLIGILGGVETLGLLGLFVGPGTMSALMMLWRDYVSARKPVDPVVASPTE